MQDRVILHCDANSFFASVEMVFHPEYRDVPMAVCGNEEERRGIVLAKNQVAKKYRIETAETVYSARKKCPHLITVPPRYHEYEKFSRELNRIYARYTDLIEPFGIDESWLDVTGSQKLFGDGNAIAERIRREVKEELGITVSIGVSFNKVFAKLGSDYRKPDAITEISRDNMRQIVFPLPVGSLLFVGRKTAEALERIGIRTIGDLALTSPLFLEKQFGKHGILMSLYARGEDDSPVLPPPEENHAKSIGSGMTFPQNLIGEGMVREGLYPLAEEVATQMRRTGRVCATVSLTIRDEFLHTISRQQAVLPPTDIAASLIENAIDIYRREWSPSRPIRMLTLTAMNLTEREPQQIGLFDDENEDSRREKRRELEKTVDAIRTKYGRDSLAYGHTKGKKIPQVRPHKTDT